VRWRCWSKSRFITHPTERKPRGHVDITKMVDASDQGSEEDRIDACLSSSRPVGIGGVCDQSDDYGRSKLRTTNDIRALNNRHIQRQPSQLSVMPCHAIIQMDGELARRMT